MNFAGDFARAERRRIVVVVVGGGLTARHNLECGIRSRTAKAEIRGVGKLTRLRQGAFKPTKESGRQ